MPVRLCDFKNEPYADFSQPDSAAAMRKAVASVRAEFGKEYGLHIGGKRFQTGNLLKSVNPSQPDQIVGAHHKATPELAIKAIETADRFFPQWAARPATERVALLRKAAAIVQRRKFEFNAWLVYDRVVVGTRPKRGQGSDRLCYYYALLQTDWRRPSRGQWP